MLFFSWPKIRRWAGNSSRRIFLAFKAHATTNIATSIRDPEYSLKQKDFSGESFLRNPHELINNSFRWKVKEIAQYLGLASLRSYALYALTGDKTLDLFHCNVSEDTINQNRLLKLVDQKIYFYYEEDINRRNKIWH